MMQMFSRVQPDEADFDGSEQLSLTVGVATNTTTSCNSDDQWMSSSNHSSSLTHTRTNLAVTHVLGSIARPDSCDDMTLEQLQVAFDTSCESYGAASLACSRRNSITHALGCVVDGLLYIGSYRDMCDAAAVRAAGVRAYVSVAKEVPPLPPHALAPGADSSSDGRSNGDLAFLHLPLTDSAATRLEDHFPAVFAFIDAQEAAGRPVAIYCQQGKSRSVSFALAYLMYKKRQCSECALQELRATYKRADPNVFFLAQLAEWDARRNARFMQ